jgi:hypothetical protein
MKDNTEMKGLVVEQHEDRVVLSTDQGEVPVLREKIQEIVFDDPAQSFMQVGESYENAQRWGEALAYYEHALKLNPELEEAKKASVRVRNRFWSQAATGPNSEIEKRQALYESWGKSAASGQRMAGQARTEIRALREELGLVLSKKGDWVQITQVLPQKDAALAGLKRGDRLVEIDGRSLRYLGNEVVRQKFLSPRYSNFTLEVERDLTLPKTGFERDLSEFGVQFKLEHRGTVLQSVKAGSPASRAGLKEQDLCVAVNGSSTRYLPIHKMLETIKSGPSEASTVTVRRSVILTRK